MQTIFMTYYAKNARFKSMSWKTCFGQVFCYN